MILAYPDTPEQDDVTGDGHINIENGAHQSELSEREVFEKHLREVGLELELEPSRVMS